MRHLRPDRYAVDISRRENIPSGDRTGGSCGWVDVLNVKSVTCICWILTILRRKLLSNAVSAHSLFGFLLRVNNLDARPALERLIRLCLRSCSTIDLAGTTELVW